MIIFSVLILFHELGHFWLAKKNGIIVDEFSLGMGPRIVSINKNGTQYSLKVFPFGGSCAMRDEDGEGVAAGSFNAAPIWGRISVVVAGPIFNFILAFVIAVVIVGVAGYDPPAVAAVEAGSPVAEAGLEVGDIITKFQGKRIAIARDLANYEMFIGTRAENTTIEFMRDGVAKTLTYIPESVEKYMMGFSYQGDNESDKVAITAVSVGSAFAKEGITPGDIIVGLNGTAINTIKDLNEYLTKNPWTDEVVQVEFERNGKVREVEVTPRQTTSVNIGFDYNSGRIKTTPLGVVKYALVEMRFWFDTTVQSLKMLVTGGVSVNELSGPVGVINVIGDTYDESREQGGLVTWISVLNIMLLLSVNLGIMNLLPLPALDGGRLIFLLLEAVRGRPTNRKVEGMIHFVGIVLLLSLMAYVTLHDIVKLF